MEVIGSEGIHTAWYISTLWCNTRWLKGRWTSRGLSGFRECRRLDDTTRQDGFSGGKCPRYHASQLFNLSPASSLPLLLPPPPCFFFWARFLYEHTHTRERENRDTSAKHGKPAIKFLEHVPSCKYAARVLVFETHFTYLVSSPACLEAVPLDRKWKLRTC